MNVGSLSSVMWPMTGLKGSTPTTASEELVLLEQTDEFQGECHVNCKRMEEKAVDISQNRIKL